MSPLIPGLSGADLSLLLGLDARGVEALVQRALVRARHGDREGGLRCLEALAQVRPSSALLALLAGVMADDAGDLERALAWFEAADRRLVRRAETGDLPASAGIGPAGLDEETADLVADVGLAAAEALLRRGRRAEALSWLDRPVSDRFALRHQQLRQAATGSSTGT